MTDTEEVTSSNLVTPTMNCKARASALAFFVPSLLPKTVRYPGPVYRSMAI